MKKLIILAAVALMSTSAMAQYADNAIKVNLFGFAVGQIQVGYERALNENSSVQLSLGMVSRSFDSSIGTFVSEQKDAGFIIIPEYRYYFNEALQGLYAGAFFRYRGVTTTYTTGETGDLNETEWKRTAIGGGALLGYQFILGERVALDLFAGPQFKSASSELSSGDISDGEIITFDGESEGFGARFGLNVGVTF